MRESGVGRVLVASLHQAIADVLPMRLSFYESWLTPEGLRDGSIGLAPLSAVLSFLRQEGEPYAEVMRKAGEYAAEWTAMSGASPGRLVRWMPRFIRRRMLLWKASAVVRMSYAANDATWRIRRAAAHVELRRSVFCDVREPVGRSLCVFYAAVFERTMTLFGQAVTVSIESCRGAGNPACVLVVAFSRSVAESSDSPDGDVE